MISKQITGYGVQKCHRRHSMKCCIGCGVELEVGVNWKESGRKIAHYYCTPCNSKRNKGYQNRNKNRMWVNGKIISTKHPLHKPGRYKTSDGLLSIVPVVKKSDEGYVYAFTNPYWFSKGWLKIGKAEDKEQRLGNYQTYTPLRDYYEFHSIKVSNRAKSEALAHTKIEAMEGCIDRKEEWFKFKDTEAITKAVEIMNTL